MISPEASVIFTTERDAHGLPCILYAEAGQMQRVPQEKKTIKTLYGAARVQHISTVHENFATGVLPIVGCAPPAVP